jgi:hypothetical protein
VTALVSLWPLAVIVVVLAMCVWALWLDRTPEEPAPYHDPARTAGGCAGKYGPEYYVPTMWRPDNTVPSVSGGCGDQLYRDQPVHPFTCAYCSVEFPATMVTAEAAAVLFRDHMATAHPPDHHTLAEYDAIAGLQEEAIARSEQGDEIVRLERLP